MKKMILGVAIAVLTVFCAVLPLYAGSQSDVTGFWAMPADAAGRIPIAEIYIENGAVYAFSFAYSNNTGQADLDKNNPDPALRMLSLKGMVFLYDLNYNGKEWTDGKIYNPDEGKIFYARVKLSADGNTLTIRASIDKGGLFGKNIVWKRVTDTTSIQQLQREKIRKPF